MRNHLIVLMAACLMLSACGKKEDKKSSGGQAPAPVAKAESEQADKDNSRPASGKPNLKDIVNPDKKKETKGEMAEEDKWPEPPKEERRPAKPSKPEPTKPSKPSTPSKPAPPKEDTARNYKGISVTGAQLDANYDYISLFNDGLMESLKKRTNNSSSRTRNRNNVQFAGTLVNGRHIVDPVTQDVTVILDIKEAGQTGTYVFSAATMDNRMVSMRRDPCGPFGGIEGNQNISASIACVDGSGRCKTAVLKLTRPGNTTNEAYVILRKLPAFVDVVLENPDTANSELLDFHQFIVNKALVTNGDYKLDIVSVETFEVAYGASVVRTLLIGKNRELIGHASPLVTSKGSVNWRMRSTHMSYDMADRISSMGLSNRMSMNIADARLRKADGQGLVTVSYRMRAQSAGANDALTLKYNVVPTPLMTPDFR